MMRCVAAAAFGANPADFAQEINGEQSSTVSILLTIRPVLKPA